MTFGYYLIPLLCRGNYPFELTARDYNLFLVFLPGCIFGLLDGWWVVTYLANLPRACVTTGFINCRFLFRLR